MAFPNTRKTLIQRLAGGGAESDWREFMNDYWEPVCRFAQGRGDLTHEDAEDVASEVFEVILKNALLERWSSAPSAKLRTLICCVVRKVLANRFRMEAGRQRVVREHGGKLDRYADFSDVDSADAPAEQLDAFYAAWADGILQAAIDSLLAEYDHAGRGDYFRVLYGRLCEDLSMPEIAAMLQIRLSDAENYYRHARRRLSERLQELIREHVLRYSGAQEISDEFNGEWARVGDYLRERGGLEAAVRRAYEQQATRFKLTDIKK
jgi:RNA polymerase sigma factor (sigma-70 family)